MMPSTTMASTSNLLFVSLLPSGAPSHLKESYKEGSTCYSEEACCTGAIKQLADNKEMDKAVRLQAG